MKFPYAKCDFSAIRAEGYFYVDKTPFIPHIENTVDNYLVFLRPRRFGKSTLISTLENYYDIALADRFDEIFGGLWIHQHPTPKKNAYLVLTLDFSPVASEGTTEQIASSFATQIKEALRSFISRYRTLLPHLSRLEQRLDQDGDDTAALMTTLLTIVGDAGKQLYLLIDEYDHFGNRLLSDGKTDTYKELVHASGFLRSFYAALKAFTRKSILARTFITGVSPIMLDDLSSGFNIITHISQDDAFNAMVGFTQSEVELAVDTLLHERPQLAMDPRIADRNALLGTLERYYDGYRFCRQAVDKLYNSTLVLYFLGQLIRHGRYPEQMLDLNVRTDYGRLYGLVQASSHDESGVREVLEQVLTNESVTSPLIERFGTAIPFTRAQAVSLFYYMGMLTYAEDAAMMQEPKLVVPNRVIREMQWGYLSMAMRQHDNVTVDMSHVESALSRAAIHGEIQPLIDVFQKQVLDRLSNRDLRKFNERIMKLMLMAYLCQTQIMSVVSEVEMAQGYCDLLLGLRSATMAEKYAWIIEAKYVKTSATEAMIEKKVAEGYAQIEKYIADKSLVQMLTLGRELKAGVMLFVGAKKIVWHAWPRNETPAKKRRLKQTEAKRVRK